MSVSLSRLWLGLGAVVGLSGVALAAVGAHAVADPAAQALMRQAVEMQMWHVPALLVLGFLPGTLLTRCAGAAFVLGILGFSGALYALVLGGLRIPMLAPIGGTLLMIGWALLLIAALRGR